MGCSIRFQLLALRGLMQRRPLIYNLSVQWVAEGLLWLLIAFVPWPFGSVDPVSEGVVAALVAGLALCLVWRFMFEKRGNGGRAFVGTWALVPLLALLAIVLLSLVPLPAGLVSLVSPHGVQIRHP